MMIKLIMRFPTFVAKANTSMQNISRQGELTPRGSAALPVVQLFIVFWKPSWKQDWNSRSSAHDKVDFGLSVIDEN